VTATHSSACGRFEIRGNPGDFLEEGGLLHVWAEATYVLARRDGEPVTADLLPGALTVDLGSPVGRLRFGNFVGLTEIDGVPVLVDSRKLNSAGAERMLDSVIGRLGGIPVQATAPAGSGYARTRDGARETEYLTYALVRDAMRPGGRHDLQAAIERVLARPHEQLFKERRPVPVWRADRVDAALLTQLVISSGPRMRVPAASPLANSPIVRAMNGSLPEQVTLGRAIPTTDTHENRFVVMVLEYLAQRMHEVALAANNAKVSAVARDATELARSFERWRFAPSLAPLEPMRSLPATSTVLRGRSGYREVLSFWVDLLARSKLVPPADAHRMIGLRDAATTYEYWCFFAVCDAVEAALSSGTSRPPKITWEGPTLQSDFHVSFADGAVGVRFNRRFAKGDPQYRSYSVVLRPDIVIELRGDRHVFDAKFAFDSFGIDSDDDDDPRTRARRAHVHKMHTYRDALSGVRSVRVLYPGSPASKPEFHRVDDSDGTEGVGALALTPGNAVQRGVLHHVVDALVSAHSSA
jgi:predicted component of viral defense system (DUF524 family)